MVPVPSFAFQIELGNFEKTFIQFSDFRSHLKTFCLIKNILHVFALKELLHTYLLKVFNKYT
jgi:hypothetical protein